MNIYAVYTSELTLTTSVNQSKIHLKFPDLYSLLSSDYSTKNKWMWSKEMKRKSIWYLKLFW